MLSLASLLCLPETTPNNVAICCSPFIYHLRIGLGVTWSPACALPVMNLGSGVRLCKFQRSHYHTGHLTRDGLGVTWSPACALPVMNLDSGVRLCKFQPATTIQVIWPGTSCLAFVDLHFFVCKMEVVLVISTLFRRVWKIKQDNWYKGPDQYWACNTYAVHFSYCYLKAFFKFYPIHVPILAFSQVIDQLSIWISVSLLSWKLFWHVGSSSG